MHSAEKWKRKSAEIVLCNYFSSSDSFYLNFMYLKTAHSCITFIWISCVCFIGQKENILLHRLKLSVLHYCFNSSATIPRLVKQICFHDLFSNQFNPNHKRKSVTHNFPNWKRNSVSRLPIMQEQTRSAIEFDHFHTTLKVHTTCRTNFVLHNKEGNLKT